MLYALRMHLIGNIVQSLLIAEASHTEAGNMVGEPLIGQLQQPLLEYDSHKAGLRQLRQTIHTWYTFEVKTINGTENCPVRVE